jgi:DNA-directed RNA polymerase sigma subunit (sigma70/sigma32)
MTLREVAKRLDISFVRVKQIEDKAMKKLTKFANRMADE